MPENSFNGVRRVLFSHRLGRGRLSGLGTIPLGKAHYSHLLAGRRILETFAHLGIEASELIRPEMYSAPVAFQSMKEFQRGDIHLIFKPIEDIRILRGAYNIACVVWEFDQLDTRARSNNPCSNQARMLKLVDEVWCYCSSTRDVVRKYFANVQVIPVPFAADGQAERTQERANVSSDLASIPALHLASRTVGSLGVHLSRIRSTDFVALSIFNPEDARKNLANMLQAFALFQRDKPGAVLIWKLIVDDFRRNWKIVQMLLDRYCPASEMGRNVFVVTADLPAGALMDLYRLADFYLCTSHCEGLGMPVLEAMGCGTIPISVNNTAMADYINDRNAFVIPSVLEPARLDHTWNPNLSWYAAGITPIALALETAYRSSESRRDKRRAAIETIRARYSIEHSAAWVNARLRAIRLAVDSPGWDGAP